MTIFFKTCHKEVKFPYYKFEKLVIKNEVLIKLF